jgi:hypothetical protein
LIKAYPDETKKFLQECINESENWINPVKNWINPVKLADGEAGIEDATHCIRIEENGERYQLEWGFDPGCKLARLGISVAEAEAMINAA